MKKKRIIIITGLVVIILLAIAAYVLLIIKNNTKKRFKRRVNDRNISSYIGHLKHGDCNNLIYKTLKEKELV